MKKLFVPCMILWIIFVNMLAVFATTERKIQVSMMIGSSQFDVNGSKFEAEKPFVVNGTTLVPLRLISEAFGAAISWNDSTRQIEIINGDTNVLLTIASKTAFVNKVEKQLLLEPQIVNGRTMVPIRFISENFGADVYYDPQTRGIEIKKYIASAYGVRDYAAILKNTTKSFIGDSIYDWSMSYPTDLRMKNRSFNGSEVEFVSELDNSILLIQVSPREDKTLEKIQSELGSAAEDFTIVKSGIEKNANGPYAGIVLKNSETLIEQRGIVGEKYAYNIVYASNADSNSQKDARLKLLLDSFKVGFSQVSNVEDLSDVINGMRRFQQKKLRWDILVPANWSEVKYEGQDNKVELKDGKKNKIEINLYSVEEGQTFQAWLDRVKSYINESCNPNRVKLLSLENGLVGKDSARLFLWSKPNLEEYYSYELLAQGKEFKYSVKLLFSSDVYKDPKQLAVMKKMIDSFRFSEQEAKSTVLYKEPITDLNIQTTEKIENKSDGWSFKVPANWEAHEDNNEENYTSYVGYNGRMLVELFLRKDITLERFINEYEKKLEKLKNDSEQLSNLKKESVTEKGIRMVRYDYDIVFDDQAYKMTSYIFEKNGIIFDFMMSIRDLNNTEKNVAILKSIWNSFKIG